ncbi:MAG: ferredoxin [Bacteroidetes bacterium]|nr:ferredoxin [Bacteroidota bacterium]
MSTYLLQLERDSCIGSHACNAAAPEYWIKAEDGKIDLVDSIFNEESDLWEITINEKALELNKNAESGCPVDAISLLPVKSNSDSKDESSSGNI